MEEGSGVEWPLRSSGASTYVGRKTRTRPGSKSRQFGRTRSLKGLSATTFLAFRTYVKRLFLRLFARTANPSLVAALKQWYHSAGEEKKEKKTLSRALWSWRSRSSISPNTSSRPNSSPEARPLAEQLEQGLVRETGEAAWLSLLPNLDGIACTTSASVALAGCGQVFAGAVLLLAEQFELDLVSETDGMTVMGSGCDSRSIGLVGRGSSSGGGGLALFVAGAATTCVMVGDVGRSAIGLAGNQVRVSAASGRSLEARVANVSGTSSSNAVSAIAVTSLRAGSHDGAVYILSVVGVDIAGASTAVGDLD